MDVRSRFASAPPVVVSSPKICAHPGAAQSRETAQNLIPNIVTPPVGRRSLSGSRASAVVTAVILVVGNLAASLAIAAPEPQPGAAVAAFGVGVLVLVPGERLVVSLHLHRG